MINIKKSIQFILYICVFTNFLFLCSCQLNSFNTSEVLFEDDFEHSLDNWWIEGSRSVSCQNGRLLINANDDSKRSNMFSTVWFRQKISGDVKIEFDAYVIASEYDVNNINFFLHYSLPQGGDLYETQAERFDGEYSKYHNLNGYILTYVKDNKADRKMREKGRFRIRKCPGFELVSEKFKGDSNNRVVREIEISIRNSVISYKVDGKLMCKAYDPAPYSEGHFAIRTYMTELWIDNLLVTKL